MMDRVVQFPHRYKAVKVAGEENVFDFVPMPGVTTEVGTPLNKATLLSDDTANVYGLSGSDATVNNALLRIAAVGEFKTLQDTDFPSGQKTTSKIIELPIRPKVIILFPMKLNVKDSGAPVPNYDFQDPRVRDRDVVCVLATSKVEVTSRYATVSFELKYNQLIITGTVSPTASTAFIKGVSGYEDQGYIALC